ncbi:MAG: hypothetical protein H3Z53_11280 [archaeon]|nr:hypothetical protein [archaeon]MCP8314934.1 hypothetical protein [archaeon]
MAEKRPRCFLTETEVKILAYLSRSESPKYLTQMEADTKILRPVLHDNIKLLLKKQYVVPHKQGVEVFYSLTDEGEALTWALSKPAELASVYKEHIKEERRRLQEKEAVISMGKGRQLQTLATLKSNFDRLSSKEKVKFLEDVFAEKELQEGIQILEYLLSRKRSSKIGR